MGKICLHVLVILIALCGSTFAAHVFYVDPIKGSDDGDGSTARPWRMLETVIAKGQLKRLHDGDTIELATGYHGSIEFSGDNESMVTITAGKGQRPRASRVTISSGTNWTVRGLVVSPSFAKEPYKGSIISFGESGKSSKITIENCYVFTVEDASPWDAQAWMNANSGINMGRFGRDLTLRNCYVKNTRFGIQLSAFDSLCEGNVVSDYSADGIRVTRDGQTVQYNVVKNVYVSQADGDSNHDDGIQVFLFNKGTGTVKNIKAIGNIIIGREDPNQKLQNDMQGLGFFDGPLVDFVVSDNVVFVHHWHGIALYDAQNARVERNVVWTPEDEEARGWIMFGNKLKLAKDNVAKSNYACTFKLKEPGTIEDHNAPSTEAIYKKALDQAYKTICDKFGAQHFAADRPRIGNK